MEKLKMLIVIGKKEKGEAINNFLKTKNIPIQFSCLGEGTVESKLSFYLGISNTAKNITFAIIKEKQIKRLLTSLDKLLELSEKGNGVAFTIPLTSVISNLSLDYLTSNTKRRLSNG